MERRVKITLFLILFLTFLATAGLVQARESIHVMAGSGCEDCIVSAAVKGNGTGLYELSAEELDAVEAGGFYAMPSGSNTDYGRIILWDETGDEQGGGSKASMRGDLLIVR